MFATEIGRKTLQSHRPFFLNEPDEPEAMPVELL